MKANKLILRSQTSWLDGAIVLHVISNPAILIRLIAG